MPRPEALRRDVLKLDPIPEALEPLDEPLRDLSLVERLEVAAAEVAVLDPVADDVVDRRHAATATMAFLGPRRARRRRN